MERSRAQILVHGVPNKPRNQEPSMFEIFTWNDKKSQQNFQNLRYNKQTSYSNQVQQNQNDNQCKLNKNRSQQVALSRSPHKYNHQLYMYNDQDDKAKIIIQQSTKNLIQKQLSPNQKKVKINERVKSRSLNPNDQNDRYQISKRKKKIKQFKMLSRELPDSAFTTYYGKPAFSNYGSGNHALYKKTFNIMPHAGKNHPQYQQSYQTALVKGKQIKENHIPKKPLEIFKPEENNLQYSDYYAIPIKKPNLIETVRFSQDKSYLQRKARTPKHNELNFIPERESQYDNLKFKKSEHSDGKKLKKVTSLKNFQNKKNDYPLVNSRDHLRQILVQKKRQQNRIAYKVTQCYPLPYEACQKACQTKASRWSQMKPAGILSPRSDHIQDVFYPNNIWS